MGIVTAWLIITLTILVQNLSKPGGLTQRPRYDRGFIGEGMPSDSCRKEDVFYSLNIQEQNQKDSFGEDIPNMTCSKEGVSSPINMQAQRRGFLREDILNDFCRKEDVFYPLNIQQQTQKGFFGESIPNKTCSKEGVTYSTNKQAHRKKYVCKENIPSDKCRLEDIFCPFNKQAETQNEKMEISDEWQLREWTTTIYNLSLLGLRLMVTWMLYLEKLLTIILVFGLLSMLKEENMSPFSFLGSLINGSLKNVSVTVPFFTTRMVIRVMRKVFNTVIKAFSSLKVSQCLESMHQKIGKFTSCSCAIQQLVFGNWLVQSTCSRCDMYIMKLPEEEYNPKLVVLCCIWIVPSYLLIFVMAIIGLLIWMFLFTLDVVLYCMWMMIFLLCTCTSHIGSCMLCIISVLPSSIKDVLIDICELDETSFKNDMHQVKDGTKQKECLHVRNPDECTDDFIDIDLKMSLKRKYVGLRIRLPEDRERLNEQKLACVYSPAVLKILVIGMVNSRSFTPTACYQETNLYDYEDVIFHYHVPVIFGRKLTKAVFLCGQRNNDSTQKQLKNEVKSKKQPQEVCNKQCCNKRSNSSQQPSHQNEIIDGRNRVDEVVTSVPLLQTVQDCYLWEPTFCEKPALTEGEALELPLPAPYDSKGFDVLMEPEE